MSFVFDTDDLLVELIVPDFVFEVADLRDEATFDLLDALELLTVPAL